LLLALIGILSATTLQARTYATSIGGGDGGVRFTLDCPAGEFLVGVAGNFGSWVDHIGTVCAPWDRAHQTLGTPHVSFIFAGRSQGGRPFSAICPEGTALERIDFQNTTVDDSAQQYGTRIGFVQNLELQCRPMVPPYYQVVSPKVLSDNGEGARPFAGGVLDVPSTVGCYGADERATGLIGRSGDFVDALGFTCTTIPRSLNVPDTPSALETHGDVATGQQRLPDRSRAAQVPGIDHSSAPPPPATAPADLPLGPTPGVLTASGMRYAYPYLRDKNGTYRLMDWCREYGQDCGQVAARAFCTAANGGRQPNPVDFAQFVDSGRFQPSVTYTTRALCTAPTCDSFAYIVCHE
jgi:hypothetical protein